MPNQKKNKPRPPYIDDILMPFGKYVGEYVCDLPLDYLEWLDENCDLNGDLALAVKTFIAEAYDKM